VAHHERAKGPVLGIRTLSAAQPEDEPKVQAIVRELRRQYRKKATVRLYQRQVRADGIRIKLYVVVVRQRTDGPPIV
jgi:hypothetical protein